MVYMNFKDKTDTRSIRFQPDPLEPKVDLGHKVYTVKIYDCFGNLVKQLHKQDYGLYWDCKDGRGLEIRGGKYEFVFEAE
jgi:hypothetical protein